MKIFVIQDDIDRAIDLRSRWETEISATCPIALALTRTLNTKVRVSCVAAYVNGIKYVLPHAAIQFIDYFDYELTVEPFEFELDII